MTEIRLCWDPEIDSEREAECAGPWLPHTDENLEMLESLVVAGAEGYGHGTHWIERRFERPSGRTGFVAAITRRPAWERLFARIGLGRPVNDRRELR